MAFLTCPRCGLFSPAGAERCDCGFEFAQSNSVPRRSKPLSDLVLHGNQGKTLYVSGDTIRIEKHGLLAAKREKTILIRSVTSVEGEEAWWGCRLHSVLDRWR